MIIDAHINLTTPAIADDQYGGKGTFEDVIKAYDECPIQIDKLVVMPMGMVWEYASINDYIAKSVKKDQRLVGMGRINPWNKGAVKEMERSVKELGLKGFRLHPLMQAFSPDNRDLMNPIFEKAQELDVPLEFHQGGSDAATPKYLAPAAERFPDVKVIIEHGGVSTAVSFARKFKNIYLCMCGTVSAWLGAIKSVGAERIISGSDWPFGSIEIQMKNKWNLTKISEKDRRLILGENIARLLHIE